MNELAVLAKLCEDDSGTEALCVSPSTILPPSDGVVDDKIQQNDEDDKLVPSKISPMSSSVKLRSLDQQYSTLKGSQMKNGVKFLIHMCTTHYESLSDNHRKLIQQVTSTGATLD